MIRVFQGTARDGAGNIIQNGNITCYLHGTTTPVTIYTDAGCTIPVQSITTNSLDGSFIFFINDNGTTVYDLQVAGMAYPGVSLVPKLYQYINPTLTSPAYITGPQGPAAPTLYFEPEPADEPLHIPGQQGTPGTTGSQGPTGPPIYFESDPAEDPIFVPGSQGATGAPGTTGGQGPTGPAIYLDAADPEDIPMIAPIVGPAGPQGIPGASVNPTRTRQVLTSSSGTYTTPIGVAYLWVRMVGGGAGGAGSGTSASGGTGASGGETAFGSFAHCYGASGGAVNGGGSGGTGDVNSPASGIVWPGQAGSDAPINSATCPYLKGGFGGSSFFGGGGAPSTTAGGNAAVPYTGSGGAGGQSSNINGSYGGGGGGAGAFADFIVTSPSSSYSFTVGAGGSGGSYGTSGYTGGTGTQGVIIVDEFYNW